MADDPLSYWAKIGLDSSEFIGGLSKSSQGMLAFARDVTVTMNMTLMIFDQFMAYGQKFIDLANAAAVFQSQIDRLGITTGISSEEMYKWSNVARYADSDISSLSTTLRKLSIGMVDSGDAGEKARAMLEGMHVSIKNADGSYRSLSDVFPEVIAGLNGIEDAGTKNAVAIALFGRGYQELAGYMLLSKEQLKGHFDTGWAPTEAQSQKLRDYERATKDLDKSMTDFKYMLGSELAPVLRDIVDLFNTELIPAMNDAGGVGITLSGSFHFVADMIDDAANGAALLKLALDANITNYGEFYTKFEKIQSQHMVNKAARDDAVETREMMAEIANTPTSGSTLHDPFGLLTKKPKPDFKLPEDTAKDAGKDESLTLSEILRKQNRLAVLQWDKRDAEKDYNDLLKTGDKTQADYNEKVDRARLKMEALVQDVADLTAELLKAGVAASGISSGLTYNQQFASSLAPGGVGPDQAGFSEMANWSQEDLQKAAGGDFGLTGGSKNTMEKSQQYLSRMQGKGAGDGTAGAGKKTVPLADQSAIDTKTISKELKTQGDAYTTLNDTIVKGWIDLEKNGLTHYTAMGEFARIQAQAELDYMAQCVNFGGENPIVQNKIIMGKDGPDWTPPVFTAVSAPTLAAADYSSVNTLGSSLSKEKGEEKGGNTVNQDITIINNGVKTDAEGMSKSLGKIAALGGGLP